jgi:hypothetical protein
MSSRLVTPITHDRTGSGDTSLGVVRIARVLCGGAVLTGSIAAALIGGTISMPTLTPMWLALLGGGIVSAWCSVSFLCGAAIVASTS